MIFPRSFALLALVFLSAGLARAEQIGEVESYRQRFEQQVGRSVESYLGLAMLSEVEPS